jgi:hypothetical protein
LAPSLRSGSNARGWVGRGITKFARRPSPPRHRQNTHPVQGRNGSKFAFPHASHKLAFDKS